MEPNPAGRAGPFAMSTAPLSPLPIRSPEQLQACARLRRFWHGLVDLCPGPVGPRGCAGTWGCSGPALVWVTVLFGLINLGLLTVFASGWNERVT